MSTCVVTGTILDQSYEPVPGAIVTATLTGTDRYLGLVTPAQQTATADENGQVQFTLFRNAVGSESTQYRFIARTPEGRKVLDAFATVPDAATANLYSILDLQPPPSLSDAQVAENEATAQAAIAATQAGIATTQAGIATDKAVATAADRVATGQDATATAADRVQTGLDRVATGQDTVATAADRVQTGLDRVATAADRVATGQDATATAADRVAVAADRLIAETASDNVLSTLANVTSAIAANTGAIAENTSWIAEQDPLA